MSEYICPLNGRPCIRPGRIIPTVTGLSDEGYCGGERFEDGICPRFISYAKGKFLEQGNDPKNLIFERQSPDTVYARDRKTLGRIRIQSGNTGIIFTTRKQK